VPDRSDGARTWSRVLSELAQVSVLVEWERPTWRVSWQDGPSREALMRRASALGEYRVGSWRHRGNGCAARPGRAVLAASVMLAAGPGLTGRVVTYRWPAGGPPDDLLGPSGERPEPGADIARPQNLFSGAAAADGNAGPDQTRPGGRPTRHPGGRALLAAAGWPAGPALANGKSAGRARRRGGAADR